MVSTVPFTSSSFAAMPFDPNIPAIALAYAVLQVAALVFFRGAWARAAAVPAVYMALALALFDLSMPADLPLAVLPLALGLPVAVLYLAALWLARGAAALRRSV
jgi:hypothetical protein